MPDVLPKYPIFIPSKGRHDVAYTARCLIDDGVPFTLVVEPQEVDAYAERFGEDRLLVLPDNDRGLIFARNFIFEHAVERGDKRHWQVDDNIRSFYRRYKAQRVYCEAGVAFRAVEDFADRYENVAVAGMNYKMFVPDDQHIKPFFLNAHVYSNTLILNSIPHRYRPPANEDVDLCLQVLADGWCTVEFNAFLADKIWTMTVKGGQTDHAYQGDGRLYMARSLERAWPGVVRTVRRFNRPQHYINGDWKKFDNKLIRRSDIDWKALEEQGSNNYGMKLKEVAPIQSDRLRDVLGMNDDEDD